MAAGGIDPDWAAGWFRWTVGTILVAFGGVAGHLYQRLTRMEDAQKRHEHAVDADIREGDGKLWDVIDLMRRDLGSHQVEMARQVGQLVTTEHHHRDMQELADRFDRAIDRLASRLEARSSL